MTRSLLTGVLVAVSLLALASVTAGEDGKRGPLPTAFQTVGGEKISAHDATVTELIFVARWCRPCEKTVSQLRRRTGVLRRTGYQAIVVGLSQRQDQAAFTKWAGSLGTHRQLVYDADGLLEQAYGVSLVPWHVVTDSRGEILYSGTEAPTVEALKAWLKKN